MIWKGKEIELIHHPDIAPGSWDFWRPGKIDFGSSDTSFSSLQISASKQ